MCDYYITNGRQYISTKNGIHAVSSVKEATKGNITKALNLLKTLPKTLSNLSEWTILPVPEGTEDTLSGKDVRNHIPFIDFNSMLEDLNQFTEKAEKYAQYSKSINRQIAEIELEIEDLYHYIEFSNFNAAQGYHAYKMLKERLIKRRQLKDEQKILDVIQEKNMLTCTKDIIDNTVSKLESRSYRPRVLEELFNNK
jgi:hypothetical protein